MIWGSRRRSSSLWHVKGWATECTSLVSQHLLLEAAKSDWFGYHVAPLSTDFSWKPTYRKTQFLDSTLKFFPNIKRWNCDYAQPTWLFAHHLVMKHSELSLTTTYHPVNDGRSKFKHGQHPNHSICSIHFNTCLVVVCWLRLSTNKGRDVQIIAKQHHHESQFQKLTSWPKLTSKLLGI